MGRRSNYQNLNKSRRNKKSKAAKLRWAKRNMNETASQDHLPPFPIYQECPNDEDMSSTGSPNNSVPASDQNSSLDDWSSELTVDPNMCLKKYEPHYFVREKEFGVISDSECDRILNYPLTVEGCLKEPLPIAGNRIVELGYLIEKVLQLQYEHCQICTFGKICVKSELRKGFVSTIILQCSHCSKSFKVETEDPKTPVSVINTGAVWGTLATGSTYGHMEEHFSCMDIPVMSKVMFYAIEEEQAREWKLSMWRSMEAAGAKEKEYAISQQHFSSDGIPWITVYVDGSWSKRSYGTNFNSLSGMVGIIGKHTGQLLYIGVRNRFCSICVRAEHREEQPREHTCYKNWSESAPSMEADMVVEGFNLSQEMHGVKYGKFIADGDSSVFARIKQKVTYSEEVTKLECTNHALKNYGKNLRAIKKDTQISANGRKLLTIKLINKLTKRAKTSIYEHAKEQKNVSLLREDLENGLHRVFGDHMKCREGICNNVGNQTESLIFQLQSTSMYHHLRGALNLLTRKTHLLIENENNNAAERLMNVVARFNMGKRLNLIQRGSYGHRVYLSGLRYNEGSNWYSSPWKKATHSSPGQYFKKFIYKSQMNHASKVRRQLIPTTDFSTTTKQAKQKLINTDYGPNAEQPTEDPDIILMEINRLLETLQVTIEERDRIQELSIGQFGNAYYESERKLRLTASMFGRVIKRKSYTPCHAIVKSCLKPSLFYSKATEYGISKEEVALNLFQTIMKIKVNSSGLWVDLNHGFLAASPDGMTTDDCIVEVKCIFLDPSIKVEDIKGLISLKNN